MSGLLIIMEGLDGSGKATQSKLLVQVLEQQGKNVRTVSFPNYKSQASIPAQMYLNGEFGTRPEDVNAYAASTFYAIDRYASYKIEWQEFYESGGIIVADRYTTSNAIHQCGKLPQSEWDDYLNWLFSFEYDKLTIPAPNLVVYLDMSVDVSQNLMSKRYDGHNEKKDIHERDKAHLEKSRAAAHYCAEKFGWETVLCDDGKKAYPIESIAEAVLEKVQAFLNI